MPKRKLRSVAKIEEAIALFGALREEQVATRRSRDAVENTCRLIEILHWALDDGTESVKLSEKGMGLLRERYPEVASPSSAQPDQPEPMRFSQAVAEFEALCDASEQCKDKYRTLKTEYVAAWSVTGRKLEYRAYVADVLNTGDQTSLEAVLAAVDAILNPPPEQDVAAALDSVDVEDLARAEDNGMAPAAVPGGLPEPAVFDSAEEDDAHAG